MKKSEKWTSTDIDMSMSVDQLEKSSLVDIDQEKSSVVDINHQWTTLIKKCIFKFWKNEIILVFKILSFKSTFGLKLKILKNKKNFIFSEFKIHLFYLVKVDQLKKAGCIFQPVDVDGCLFLGRRQAALFITPSRRKRVSLFPRTT